MQSCDSALASLGEESEKGGNGNSEMNRYNQYHSARFRTSRGFTLIELMITIAIVAILMAIAVPAYNDYTVRAKVIECIHNAAVAKTGISEYRQSLGSWPPTMEDAGLQGAGDTEFCIAFINYDAATGSFAIDVDEASVDPKVGTIEPELVPTTLPSGFIDWNCVNGATAIGDMKYLPSTCRDS